MRGHRDLEILAGGSLICAVAALAIAWSPLSLIFAAPLALAAPGYAIVAATFARKRIGRPLFLALSVGLSLAILVLGGLLLNYTPGGARAISWAVLLLLIILNGSRVAALRRPAAPRRPLPRLRIDWRSGGLLAGGALLTAIALALAFTTLPAKNARGYTQLWLAPRTDTATGGAEVGVGSEEQHKTGYVLQVRLGDRARPLMRRFELKPGESRTVKVDAPQSPKRETVPLTALLYRQDQPTQIYRRVSGWILEAPR